VEKNQLGKFVKKRKVYSIEYDFIFIPRLKFFQKSLVDCPKLIQPSASSKALMKRRSYSSHIVDSKNCIHKENSNCKIVKIFENTAYNHPRFKVKKSIDPVKNFQESKFKIFGDKTRTDVNLIKRLRNEDLMKYV